MFNHYVIVYNGLLVGLVLKMFNCFPIRILWTLMVLNYT
jgi:hypothetical protein